MEYLEPEYQKNLEEFNNKNEVDILNNNNLSKEENNSNNKKRGNSILNPIKYYNQNQKEYSRINNNYQENNINNINVKKKNVFFSFLQDLKSYTPSYSPKCGIISSFIFMICFLGLGIPQKIYSKNHLEYKLNYTKCKPNDNNICNITFNIDKKLNSEVLIYYQLNNFYLNHRNIVKSKNT
jgi:hypothetical protein